MDCESQELHRQLRRRSDNSNTLYSFSSSRQQKTASEDQNKKPVNLLEKYYPFFLEQQRLLDQLRIKVKEEQIHVEKLFTQSETSSVLEAIDNIYELHSDVEDDGKNSEFDRDCIPENPDLILGRDVNIINTEPNDHSNNEDSYNSFQIEDGNNREFIIDAKHSENNKSESEDCTNLKNVEFPQSTEDDAIECELLREECSDSEKSREDNIEYDILYVSDTTNNDVKSTDDSQQSVISIDLGIPNYQIVVDDKSFSNNALNISPDSPRSLATRSELSFDSDTPSNPFEVTASSIPSIINQMDDFCPDGETSSGSLLPSIGPSSSVDSPGDAVNENGIEITDVLFKSPGSSNDELIQCEFCSSRFPTLPDLNCHLNTHRGTELIKPEDAYKPKRSTFSCYRCSKVFKSMRGLRYHKNWHKQKDRVSYACHLGREKFKTPFSKRQHILQHDADTSISVSKMETKGLSNKKVLKSSHKWSIEQKVSYKCFYCPDTFTNRNILLHHLIIHKVPAGGYKCPVCDLNFTKKQLFIFHLDEEHREFLLSHILNLKSCRNEFVKPNQNDVSSKISISPTSPSRQSDSSKVIIRQSLTSSKMSLTCIYCNVACDNQEELRSHIQTHSISSCKPIYPCPKCKRVYKIQRFLLSHFPKCQNEQKSYDLETSQSLPSSSHLEEFSRPSSSLL